VWALLLDPDGFIAEGTGSNFFIVKDGVLYTPEPRNILRGISRAYVMELTETMGIECYEKNIEVYDAMVADEAFFTSTPFCMLPVVKIDDMDIGTGKVGPMYKRLMAKWSENVGVDIIGQIKKYAAEYNEAGPTAPTPYGFKSSDK
jgi:branched-chain amino acid aminotransferase